jgi:hypothetical protein
VKKRILIQCGDHFENQGRILSLACWLRDLKLCPIILMYDRNNSSDIFELEGVKVVYLNDYRKNNKLLNVNKKRFDDITYVSQIREPWKFSGNNLLRQKQIIRRDYTALFNLVVNEKIDFLGVWNGYTGNIANILRVISKLESIPSFYMERSFFSGALFVDNQGVNGFSNLSDLTYEDFEFQNIVDTGFTCIKDTDSRKSGYVFIPLQVQTDTNNILFSPHVKSMRKLILKVYAEVKRLNFEKGLNLHVVVRSHPEEIESDLGLPVLEDIIYDSKSDFLSLCKNSYCVVTINSTVGIEAASVGAKVITLGKSIYSNKSITIDSNYSDLFECLEMCLDWVLDKHKFDKYVSYVYENNTVNFTNFPIQLNKLFGLVDSNIPSSTQSIVLTKMRNVFSTSGRLLFKYVSDEVPRLNLTYRKNEVIADKDFYLSYLKKYFGLDVDLNIIRSG